MFGDRRAEKPKSIIERIPEKFSVIHHAGVMLFAGLLHAGAYHEYHNASKQIAELKMVAKVAESDIATMAWLARDMELKMGQSYRTLSNSQRFFGVQQNILQELNSGKARTLAISDVLGYEEYFVEGIPMETIEKGTINFLKAAQKLLEMRLKEEDPTLISDEVLNAMLAEQGEYDENQPSAFVLFAEGRGNCLARAKAEAMLVDYVFEENRGASWMNTEIYRGYIDATGKKQPGHIRLVLDFEGSDTWTVMEGHEVYEAPRLDDHVTRIEAHDAFVRGSAAAMGIVEGGGADYDYNPKRLGIRFPDSPIRYLGSEDGETQWWATLPAQPESGKQHYGLADGIDILDEAISDGQIRDLVELKKESAELPRRFEEFLRVHRGEGVEMTESSAITNSGRAGIAKVIILPLSASRETRIQTEAFVAQLRKAKPDAKFKLLYGITTTNQKIIPLSDPESEYIFLIPPTPELIAQYPVLPQRSRVVVKDLTIALQEKGIDPMKFSMTTCDPVTTLENLQALNAFVEDAVNLHPHVAYILDLPEEITEIPISAHTDVISRFGKALEGKTLFPTRGDLDVSLFHGALPSIHSKEHFTINFGADLSEHGLNSFILGFGTEFSLGNTGSFTFYGPTSVEEGWKLYGPKFKNNRFGSTLTFDDDVFLGSRAFAGVDQDIAIEMANSSLKNVDPHVFDGLHNDIYLYARTEVQNPDPELFSDNYIDTDVIEQRIRAEVRMPSTVTMTVVDDWAHRYLRIAPNKEMEQKGDENNAKELNEK